MTDITVSKLNKFYGEHHVLKDLSFTIEHGERVGLLGDNGSGKTTLFKILAGECDFDSGEVSIPPGQVVAVVSQIPDYPPEYTVIDVLRSAFSQLYDIEHKMRELEQEMKSHTSDDLLRYYDELCAKFERMGGYDSETEINKICNGLSISDDMLTRPFSSLSGGEKTRITIAVAILQEPDILLLDEPTNHLDMEAVEWLEEFLPRFRGTVFIISHDRYFIDKCVTRIIELDDGEAEFYSGNYTFYLAERAARYEEQLKKYKAEQAQIKRLELTAERMHGWGLGNKKLQVRAFAIEKRIERMRRTEKPKELHSSLSAQFNSRGFSGDNVLKTNAIEKAFGDRVLFSDINLTIKNGDRIALIGENGSGKSTLLDIIAKKASADHGTVLYNPSIKVAMLPQIIKFSDENRTILDTLLYDLHVSTQTARNRLAAFSFFGDEVFDRVSTLSGGERSRLMLCEIMASDINFLILDEPTNHLDIASREWIEQAVADFEGTLLFVSHDRFFINRFANRIWELRDGTIEDFEGSFEEYRRKHANAPAKPAPTKKKEPKTKNKNKKESDKLLRNVERNIEHLENEISQLAEKIEGASSDYEELNRLYTEQEALKERLEKELLLWESIYED